MEYTAKDVIIGDQWLVLSKIGEGSFGEVFKAQDIRSKRFYAVKREALGLDYPQLHHENTMYDVLAGGPCIPKCHWYGQHDGYDCIVIDLLGSSLKELQQTVREIPLDIVIDFGCQLTSCLEHIHNKGLVYRDIKPENFLFSASCVLTESDMNWHSVYCNPNSPPPSPPSTTTDDCRQVFSSWGNRTSLYAVDFGLATWWRNPKTKKPYPECKKPMKYKTGTARYASLNVHRGRTHARRDDMESLGYLLLDLLLAGELPWSGVTARTSKAGWDRLKTIKEEILLDDMCLGLPRGIMDFIDYTRRLRFGDRPDYDYLRRLLRGCLEVGPFSKLVATHPHTRMIPSPPRYNHTKYTYGEGNYDLKRRSSQNSYRRNKSCQNNPADNYEGVFVMDDLAQALPPINTTTPQHPHSRGQRFSSNQRRYPSSSSQRRHYYNHNHKRSYHSQNNLHHVGWNTSKQQQQQQQQEQEQQEQQQQDLQWDHNCSKISLKTP